MPRWGLKNEEISMGVVGSGGTVAGDPGVFAGSELPLFVPFSALRHTPAEPEWLWQGFVACGELTLLAGPPFAGKSLLVGGLLAAMEDGSDFLGMPTVPSTALLVSEESSSGLRGRAEKLGLMGSKSYLASRSTHVTKMPWKKLVKKATRAALNGGHSLLVIDTFAGLARLAGEEENNAGAVGERMRPLQEAAGEGLAVLVVHHTTKNGSSIRGSGAFSGVADIAICHSRAKGATTFKLQSESRYESTPATLGGRLDTSQTPWRFSATGKTSPSSSSSGPSDDHLALWDALLAHPEGLTYAQITELTGISRWQAQRRFEQWGPTKVRSTGAGKKGDPHRWFALPG